MENDDTEIITIRGTRYSIKILNREMKVAMDEYRENKNRMRGIYETMRRNDLLSEKLFGLHINLTNDYPDLA